MTRFLDSALLGKHDWPAPDYGIFPGLNRFSEKLTADDYRLAAHGSNEDPIPKPLTAHVRIPPQGREADGMVRYLACLKREIAFQGNLFDGDRRIERLILTGSGVEYLDDDQLVDLLASLHRHFGLKRGRYRDFSLSIGTDCLSVQRLTARVALGFNRFTIDIQGSGASAINRLIEIKATDWSACLHPPTVELALRLPGQTPADLSVLLERLLCLRPERITLYRDVDNCSNDWPVASGTSSSNGQVVTLERSATLALLMQGVERLTSSGYVHAGMGHLALSSDALIAEQRRGRFHYCLEGHRLYDDADCIGLGAGAISHVADGYYQNARALTDYYACLEAGELAICRGFELNADDRVRHDVIQCLMGNGYVPYVAVEKRHRIVFRNYFAPELLALLEMANDGLVDIRRDHIALTQSGLLLSNRLAMIFDSAFNELQRSYLQMI